MNIYSAIDKIAYKYDMQRRRNKANSRVVNLPQVKLSRSEEKMFEKNWGGWKSDSYRFYKGFCGSFDIKYVPNDYYDFAEHVLNLRWSAFFLQHKCCLKHIIPESHRPKTILQKIDGHYVLEDNAEISEEQATDLLKKENVFVCKVALGSGGGRGVQRIDLTNIEGKDSFLKQILAPNDLIFQKLIHQNDFLLRFNSDSVNTFRLLTLNINEHCTVLSSFLRMGSKGSFVDNLCSGGGALVGIDDNGMLNTWGITKQYEKVYEAPSGEKFKGVRVPNWVEIKNTVMAFHKQIPYANLIGWDITLSADGTPIVIEINLDSAEIEAHQIFNGPVFGDRLQEVKDYINDRKPKLRHAMITY